MLYSHGMVDSNGQAFERDCSISRGASNPIVCSALPYALPAVNDRILPTLYRGSLEPLELTKKNGPYNFMGRSYPPARMVGGWAP
jgi:hypothetical protein